jgi:hypothetical protein
MADEQNVVEVWLHSVLNDDATLVAAVPGGFWPDAVPQIGVTGVAVDFPAGSYQLLSGTDLMVHNTIRLWSNQLWLIKVSAPAGAASTLSTGVSRVDALLHGQMEVAVGDEGARLISVVREQTFSQVVIEPGGAEYRQRGGQFRIRVKDAPAA